jgi:hypothetical protein
MNDSANQNDNETPLEGLEHLVQDFLMKRKNELRDLETYVANSDFDQIRQLTHKWKGYSAPYGFGRLGELAEYMNQLAHDQNTAQCRLVVTQMKDYLTLKEQQLKHLFV